MSTPPLQAATAAPPPGPVLRDIHLPPDPSWWPPAPGWWGLVALIVLVACIAAAVWRRRRAILRQRERIVAQLDALIAHYQQDSDPVALASGMHQLLRRVARQHEPMAAQQRGKAWQETLARMPVGAAALLRLVALEKAVYLPPQSLDHHADAVAVRQWLRFAVKPANWKKKRRKAKLAGAQHE